MVPVARIGLERQQPDISNVERAIYGKMYSPPFCYCLAFCM
jgi:hypothetical protein